MKFGMYSNFPTPFRAPDAEGAAGGGVTDPAQQTPADVLNNDNPATRQNNSGNNDDLLVDFWKPVEGKDNQQQQQQQPQNQQTQDQTQNVDPQSAIQQHLNSIGLGNFELTQQEKDDLQNGNFESTMTKINQRIQQAYMQSMNSVQTLINQAVDKAVNTAKENTDSKFAAEGFKAKLFDAVPSAKDPLMEPIAESVAKRLFDRGHSESQVIMGVKQFFAKMGQLNSDNEGNSNRNGGYRPAREPDWLKIMTEG